MATPYRLSCDHSLPTHTINNISSIHIWLPIQWPAPQLPIINEMSNKTEIANTSHQLHFIVSHPSTLQQPASWLPFINNMSNSDYALDCISLCLSPNHFKQLHWGFQLTNNTLFCKHIILSEYQPRNTFCQNLKLKLTTKTNIDFDF